MTPRGGFSYYFTAHPATYVPQGWERISDKDFKSRSSKLADLSRPRGEPTRWAWDLLRIARAVYLADKAAARKSALDGWTRDIELSVDLLDVTRWEGTSRDCLHDLLNTLTGDIWNLHFRTGASDIASQWDLLEDWQADEVALFSGGLDSTAYAAHVARYHSKPIVLLAYYDPKFKRTQDELYKNLSSTNSLLNLMRLFRPARGPEASTRSRGLLFVATAIYVAASHNAQTVVVPENGLIAINPPLTRGRVAACSTRSVHPWTISLVNRLIEAAAGSVKVINPFLGLTKGEVCRRALEAGLSEPMLFRTVSCSRPPTNRSSHREQHCGSCYPCLVRRAGLLSALGKDLTPYLREPSEQPKTRPDDLLALEQWLSARFTVHDLTADLPLPKGMVPSSLLPVIRRGRRELAEMVEALLPPESSYRKGWQPVL